MRTSAEAVRTQAVSPESMASGAASTAQPMAGTSSVMPTAAADVQRLRNRVGRTERIIENLLGLGPSDREWIAAELGWIPLGPTTTGYGRLPVRDGEAARGP